MKKRHQMIRVNHAGEYGAVRIYKGQLAGLAPNSSIRTSIQHMASQEYEHHKAFSSLLVDERVRPTALQPLWHVCAYALGYISARMGDNVAMAVTVAVEDVIDEHYRNQLTQLKETDSLSTLVKKCHADELEHKDEALEKGAQTMRFYTPFTFLIRNISRAAIKLSERI